MERSEKIGLSVAAAGHVLLVAALSLGLLSPPAITPPKQDAIDVSFVDEVSLKASTKSPAPPATAVAPDVGAPEDAAPAPEAESEPTPEPKPTPPPPPPPPAPKPQPKAEPKPVPKAEPKPAPKPVVKKPEPPKPQPKPVAAAAPEVKKTPPAKPTPKPSTSTAKSTASAPAAKSTATSKAKPDTKSTATGTGKADKPRASRLGPNFLQGIAGDTPTPPAKAPASNAPLGAAEARALNQEISRQLQPYWRAPTGADVDQLVTTLRWRLNADGTIASGPEVVDQTGKTDTNRPQQQLHIEAAIRAVRAAAPFKLPPEYFNYWKNIVAFRFDKRL